MEKMVLVPVADLDMALVKLCAHGETELGAKLSADMMRAPVAAIPLKEVPGDCTDCWCTGLCADENEELQYYCKANLKLDIVRHIAEQTKPADCPIVTKE